MNRANFTQMISVFAKVYEKTLVPETLTIYYNIFREIPDEQVNRITKNCLKKCKYFPRPADVFEHFEEKAERYIYKREPAMTADQIKINQRRAKELVNKFSGKFSMPDSISKGGKESEN